MSDTQIQTPPDEWLRVWPGWQNSHTTDCAALFIDIRGSAEMSARRGMSPENIAGRIETFLEITLDLLKKGFQAQDNPIVSVPDAVKSLGDGLLCVWDFDFTLIPRNLRAKGLQTILQAVLYLNQEIGASLEDRWGASGPVETGMGLAFGMASKVTSETSSSNYIPPDYLGYVVNLAAKLQGFARPYGVVVDTDFVDRSIAARHGLESRMFVVPMLDNKKEQIYYVTGMVRPVHKWTCLAWPGLAIGHSDESSHHTGLNTKGITVVTHEGLYGKIGTLQIWPRNEAPDDHHSDPFEIIIDDFDRLATLSEEGTIDLTSISMSGVSQSQLAEIVYPALWELVQREKFLFIPIRCGLNALAWNMAYSDDLIKISRYSEILSEIKRFGPVGLYDSAGISLPVLLCCLEESTFQDNPFKGKGDPFKAKDVDFKDLIELLRTRQAAYQRELDHYGGKKLFQLYRTIDGLAAALQSGYGIHVVFGGGAWLTNPRGNGPSKVTSHIPINDRGFLWLEGAALQCKSQGEIIRIVNFLEEQILASEHQIALITAKPYGATPVNEKVLGEMLLLQKAGPCGVASSLLPDKEKGLLLTQFSRASSTFAETKILIEALQTPPMTDIILRKKPDCLEEWRKCWDMIRKEFCEETWR